jgi:hypothetical protein
MPIGWCPLADAARSRGVVLIRTLGPAGDTALQGLRTAVSLALGDRPADVVLVGEAVAVAEAAPASEAGQNLVALLEAGVRVAVEAQYPPRDELLAEIAAASFQQVF